MSIGLILIIILVIFLMIWESPKSPPTATFRIAGPVVDLAAVKMDFRYDDWFPKEPNVGYETLIYDVMIGDPTLFMRADTTVRLSVE